MQYISTRGGAPAVSFTEALLAGLAPDGGLYVPGTWPQLSHGQIAAFAGAPYAVVAAEILLRFAGDALSRDEAEAMTRAAYASFAHRAVTPLRQLDTDLWLLELFHGPTLAFKDVAMQLLRPLYEHALKAQGRKLTIVCATSGDTGGAAVEAFRGSPDIDLVVLFPHGRISEVQRRFMTAVPDQNVRCIAIDGTFDDCQAILKALFADRVFADAVDLSGVNSINWARIVAQSVYYFTAAVALGAPNRKVSFAVPTGNFGDAFAGYAARLMGLPIGRIIVATNTNDIIARALTTGDYRRGRAVATQSPAMDIQVASNFERLFFECAGRDARASGAALRAFAAGGAVQAPPPVLAAMRDALVGVAVSEEETAATIARTLRETGQLIDPHTAVAVAGAARVRPGPAAAPLVIISTAHPAKFPEAVNAAAGATPSPPAAVLARADAVERIDRLPADVEAVKHYVREFARP